MRRGDVKWLFVLNIIDLVTHIIRIRFFYCFSSRKRIELNAHKSLNEFNRFSQWCDVSFRIIGAWVREINLFFCHFWMLNTWWLIFNWQKVWWQRRRCAACEILNFHFNSFSLICDAKQVQENHIRRCYWYGRTYLRHSCKYTAYL